MTAPADSLTIAGMGTQLTLTVRGARAAEMATALREAWSRCLQPDGASPGQLMTLTLDAPDEPLARSRDQGATGNSDLAWSLVLATQAITRALIQAQTGRLLMFHAGAVSHPVSGRSLVFVAAGGTGKTTLSSVLGDHYGYLSDETVAIDAEDRILPYPKPLSERHARGEAKRERSPDDLGLLPAPAAPVAGRVLLLDRDDSHPGAPDVQEVGLLDGIELLAPEISALYALPRGLHRLARLRETTGALLRVRYAEASTLRGLAAELIGEAP